LPHENAAAEAEKQRGYQKYFNLVKIFKLKNIVKKKDNYDNKLFPELFDNS